jgi:hypothetical protein
LLAERKKDRLMMRKIVGIALLLALANCAAMDATNPLNLPQSNNSTSMPDTAIGSAPLSALKQSPLPSIEAQGTGALDAGDGTGSADASTVSGAGKMLGTQIVSLGDPTEPGLCVKTDFVQTEHLGTVAIAGGQPMQVTLRPLEGSGSPQISLAALRLLGASLTALPEVTLSRL